LLQVFDGVQCCVARLLIAMGRQRTVMLMNVFSFWLIGVPLGAFLAFKLNLGLPGLWIGFVVGTSTIAMIGLVIISRVDWNQRAIEAQDRVNEINSTSEEEKEAYHLLHSPERSSARTLSEARPLAS
jgi:MATE family multidrug resistance protein